MIIINVIVNRKNMYKNYPEQIIKIIKMPFTIDFKVTSKIKLNKNTKKGIQSHISFSFSENKKKG